MLLDAGHQRLLQDMVVNSDRMNTVMTQLEVGQTISQMKSPTYLKSLDHYKYLVKHGKMPGIKRDGPAVKANPTTTKTDPDNCDTSDSMAHAGRKCTVHNARNQFIPRQFCETYGALIS